jgi:hypothetical protein
MKSSKLILKLYAENSWASELKSQDVVPIFHSWIQTHAIPEHLLIDVADYGHVHDGPGAVLVAAEANIYVDRTDGRLGLSYARKTPLEGELRDRLRAIFRYTLQAATLLEEFLAGQIRFATDELSLKINDRLHGPNTQQTFAQVRADLKPLLAELYPGAAFQFDYHPDPRRLFETRVRIVSSDAAALPSGISQLAPI